MLVISRKRKASIRIEPIDGPDLSLTSREVFAHGAILVKLVHVGLRRVSLVVEAPGGVRGSPEHFGANRTAGRREHGTAIELSATPLLVVKGS